MEPHTRQVLAVVDSLEVGGAQMHVLTLGRMLASHGYELTVATAGNGPLVRELRAAGIPVVSLVPRDIQHRLSPGFTARLARMIAVRQVDLIHAHLYSGAVASAVVAPLHGLPLVLTHHSERAWQGPWHRSLSRWADRRADVVISVSSNLLPAIDAPASRTHLIPNGVALPPAPDDPASPGMRGALGLPPDAYVTAWVGRFTEEKDPHAFVRVAARVAARCPHAHFLLVGDGPLRGSVEREVETLGLRSRTTLLGYRRCAAELMPAADVVALTSRREAAPLVVLEAMAASRPVVAGAAGDVPLQVVDGVTGFVLQPGDDGGFAEALARLADPALRRRLGEEGRRRAARQFTAELMAQRTLAVYEAVLSARPAYLLRPARAAAIAERPRG